jgi:hypothetical protein
MVTSQKNLSPAQLAMQMRARRTKRMMLWNLGLFVVILILAGAVWGFKSGWFANRSMVENVDRGVTTPAQPTESPVDSTDASLEPAKTPARKFAVICDVSVHAQPHMSAFLPGAMSQFNQKQLVDVMVLSSDGGFVSQTNGLAAMTSAARSSACDFVAKAPLATNTSAMSAIKRAVEENAEAVYLLTTPPRAQEFGDDPMAALSKLTSGQKLIVNCILFTDATDSKADLATFKLLADGTHGAYLPVTK